MQTGLMLYKDKIEVTAEEANTYNLNENNYEAFSCMDCLNYNLKKGWEVDESFICLADDDMPLVGVCMTCKEKAVQGEY
jgi:hypothetical protein